MGNDPNSLPCDGCGLLASPEHIAQRLRRLELSTRFRPVHIGVLFVALGPSLRPEDDFYGPAKANAFLGPFLDALEIRPSSDKRNGDHNDSTARLAEFQHRGHYQVYLSECPLPENPEAAASAIARLAPTFLRRVRFNYKPRLIAPLGQELSPLIDVLMSAGIGPIVMQDQGQLLPVPSTANREWADLFQRAVASVAPRELLSAGYDRIQLTQSESDLGAGGGT